MTAWKGSPLLSLGAKSELCFCIASTRPAVDTGSRVTEPNSYGKQDWRRGCQHALTGAPKRAKRESEASTRPRQLRNESVRARLRSVRSGEQSRISGKDARLHLASMGWRSSRRGGSKASWWLGEKVPEQESSGVPAASSSRLFEPSHICLAGVSHEGRTRAAINSTSSGRPPFAPPRSLVPLPSTYTRVTIMSKQAAQAAAQMVRCVRLPSRKSSHLRSGRRASPARLPPSSP